jgi:hypothetical protein
VPGAVLTPVAAGAEDRGPCRLGIGGRQWSGDEPAAV